MRHPSSQAGNKSVALNAKVNVRAVLADLECGWDEISSKTSKVLLLRD